MEMHHGDVLNWRTGIWSLILRILPAVTSTGKLNERRASLRMGMFSSSTSPAGKYIVYAMRNKDKQLYHSTREQCHRQLGGIQVLQILSQIRVQHPRYEVSQHACLLTTDTNPIKYLFLFHALKPQL